VRRVLLSQFLYVFSKHDSNKYNVLATLSQPVRARSENFSVIRVATPFANSEESGVHKSNHENDD